jgi:hypothetical protein
LGRQKFKADYWGIFLSFQVLKSIASSALDEAARSSVQHCSTELSSCSTALVPTLFTNPVCLNRKVTCRPGHAYNGTSAIVVLAAIEQGNLRAAIRRLAFALSEPQACESSAHIGLAECALPSEGKGHTFESCRVRHFFFTLQRDMRALTETLALSHSSE